MSIEEKKRRPLMVPAYLAEEIKKIASKRGMTLSSYMKALLQAVVEAEKQNYYPPRLIREALNLNKMLASGMALIPVELLRKCSIEFNEAKTISAVMARLFMNLGIEATELLGLVLAPLNTLIYEGEKLIVLPTIKENKTLEATLRGILEAYSKAGVIDFKEEDSGTIVIIKKR